MSYFTIFMSYFTLKLFYGVSFISLTSKLLLFDHVSFVFSECHNFEGKVIYLLAQIFFERAHILLGQNDQILIVKGINS